MRRQDSPRQHSPLDVVRRWYTTPHDFDWVFIHRSMRPLQSLIRGVVAGAVVLYAAVLALMMFSPNGPTGTGPRTFALTVLVVQIVAAGYLMLGPLPDQKWQFVVFLVFGDVGLASVILLDVPTSALIGTFLFAISGSMCTFFLGPKILLVHIAFSNAVILFIGIQTYLQDLWGPFDAAAAVLVAAGATSAVPVFAQIAWSLVCEDARRSEIDPMTGAMNRRGLQNALDDLWTQAHRDRHAVVIMLVDIDHFKSVNDRFGHDQGDAVIVLVADRLSDLIRTHGVVARTGGEEFVAVLVGQQDEIRDIVARVDTCLQNDSDPVPVTVSTGAAVLVSDSKAWHSGPEIITLATRTADSLMYRAKAAGGNRTVSEQL